MDPTGGISAKLTGALAGSPVKPLIDSATLAAGCLDRPTAIGAGNPRDPPIKLFSPVINRVALTARRLARYFAPPIAPNPRKP
ncbi:MAG: hypothetical protein FD187_878 [bacterium]|nr:MAG: hypothetical protein FD142_9 [bacterium]KAF0149584.1 MAG: hypothetical protein FD187_878 [bacterium]KAF0169250.1 MAG: hypothetical protein FD158_440 [bacterium]